MPVAVEKFQRRMAMLITETEVILGKHKQTLDSLERVFLRNATPMTRGSLQDLGRAWRAVRDWTALREGLVALKENAFVVCKAQSPDELETSLREAIVLIASAYAKDVRREGLGQFIKEMFGGIWGKPVVQAFTQQGAQAPSFTERAPDDEVCKDAAREAIEKYPECRGDVEADVTRLLGPV